VPVDGGRFGSSMPSLWLLPRTFAAAGIQVDLLPSPVLGGGGGDGDRGSALRRGVRHAKRARVRINDLRVLRFERHFDRPPQSRERVP
jgi:hypothetical protein